MAALATPSRVRILARLRVVDHTVGELTAEVGMEQPAVSHQLRILRDLNLVSGIRRGRHVVYGLHDPHVAALLDEALRHVDHLRPAASTSRQDDPARTPQGATMTTDHVHDTPHSHEHAHGDEVHTHQHTAHDHDHVEHAHEHQHDGEGDTHTHPHPHQAGLEEAHAHE